VAKTDFNAPDFAPEPFHYMALHLLLLGNSAHEVASQLERPRAEITAFSKSPWCQDQIASYHERFMANVQKRVFDPMSKFYDKLEEKIELLDAMTKSENESVALRAIESWIANTLGSPVKRSEIKVEGTITHASLDELRFIRDHGRLPTEQEKLQLSAPSIEGELAHEPQNHDAE
jgi:hypothetical protein